MRVHGDGVHTLGREFVLLIFHQRDERADNDREARCGERGELIYEGFAAAGRHDHQCVAAVEQGLDRLPLAFPEIIVAEALAEESASFGLVGLLHRYFLLA